MTGLRQSRRLFWLLLVAALFMRAVLPQGYMAERETGGAITVKVCGAGHVLRIPLVRDEAPDKGDREQPPCAFAGLGGPALPPPAIAGLPPPEAAADVFLAASFTPASVSGQPPRPPARAPPTAA